MGACCVYNCKGLVYVRWSKTFDLAPCSIYSVECLYCFAGRRPVTMESNFTGVIYNQFPTTTYVWGQPPPEVLDRISQFVFLRRKVGGVTEADDTTGGKTGFAHAWWDFALAINTPPPIQRRKLKSEHNNRFVFFLQSWREQQQFY